MEYCNGGTLLDRCGERPLTMREIIGFLHQTTKGFSYIHSKNVVHRDVKPENIFMLRNGDDGTDQVMFKIGDFGLAFTHDDRDNLSTTGLTPYGTTAFMSPECYARQGFDHTCDVWSLGVSLYETVVGDEHVKPLAEAGLELCEPADPDYDQPSLCEIALQDPVDWDETKLDMLVAHFTDRLKALYNAEYYRLLSSSSNDEVTATDMQLHDLALTTLPLILRQMLAFEPTTRPSMPSVHECVVQLLVSAK
jgi:serine/threonine protein kinase